MAQAIEAVYENGVLRPKEPMALAEGETVDILVLPRTELQPADETAKTEAALHRNRDVSP